MKEKSEQSYNTEATPPVKVEAEENLKNNDSVEVAREFVLSEKSEIEQSCLSIAKLRSAIKSRAGKAFFSLALGTLLIIGESSRVAAAAEITSQDLTEEHVGTEVRAAEGDTTKESQEQREALLEKLTPRIRAFNKEISDYKGLGYEMKVGQLLGVPGIEQDPMYVSSNLEASDFSDRWLNSSIDKMVSDPLGHIKYAHAEAKELPPELGSMDGSLRIVPYSLASQRISDSRGIAYVIDWLNPDNPIAFEKKINGNVLQMELSDAEEIYDFLESLYTDLGSEQSKLDRIEAAEDIKSDWQPAFSLSEKELAPRQKDNLQKFLATCHKGIYISGVPRGQEIDRIISMDIGSGFVSPLGKNMRVNYDTAKGEQLDWRIPRCNGQIKSIHFSGPSFEINSVTEDEQLVNGEPRAKIYKDNKGNLILRSTLASPNGQSASFHYDVYPPLVFSEEAGVAPVTVDLSELGFGDVTLAYQQAETPVADGIYSNLDRGEVLEKYKDDFPALRNGANAVEKMFGFDSSENVSHIYIVNARTENAYFFDKDPDTIVIFDDLLERASESFVFQAACHETIHLYDNLFDISSGDFEDHFYTINKDFPWFFDEIKESNFLPASQGGHPQDNAKELLASFMNSMLSHPEWEAAMSARTSEFRSVYLDTAVILDRVLESLSNKEKIDNDAPILGDIKSKIAFLQK